MSSSSRWNEHSCEWSTAPPPLSCPCHALCYSNAKSNRVHNIKFMIFKFANGAGETAEPLQVNLITAPPHTKKSSGMHSSVHIRYIYTVIQPTFLQSFQHSKLKLCTHKVTSVSFPPRLWGPLYNFLCELYYL